MNKFKNFLVSTLSTLSIGSIISRACVVGSTLSIIWAAIFIGIIAMMSYYMLKNKLVKNEEYIPVLVSIPTAISLFTFVATAAMQVNYEICTTAIIAGCIALYGTLLLVAVLFRNSIKKELCWESGILLGILLFLIGVGLAPLIQYVCFVEPLVKILGLLGISTFLFSIAFAIVDTYKNK